MLHSDNYINLKTKGLKIECLSRIWQALLMIIPKENQKDLEYRKIQLKKLQEEVTDLEDLREGIDITDLGLNDFRIGFTYLKKSMAKWLIFQREQDGAVVRSTEMLKP